MKLFFIEEKGEQKGPFTISELKEKKVLDSTLVWTEGLEQWVSAKNIDELKPILIASPPPLPNKTHSTTTKDNSLNVNIGFKSPFTTDRELELSKENVIKTPKYDETYEKESSATFVGALIVVFQIILFASGAFKTEGAYALFSIASLILKIVITVWVVNISKGQNRNSSLWGIFAFFFPSISLITIGMLKKLYISEDKQFNKIKTDLPAKKQANTLNNSGSSINNFSVSINEIEIPPKLKKEMQLDTEFLKYSIKEAERYMKFFKSIKYPFYAVLILDSRNIKLSPDLLNNLNSVAAHYFQKNSINEVLINIKSG